MNGRVARTRQAESFRFTIPVALIVLIALPHAGRAGQEKPEKKKVPPIASVTRIVEQYFARSTDYKSGDIIARSDVRAIFQQMKKQLGWKPPDEKSIMKDVLDDGDFLVSQLRTADGKKFMRKVASYRLIYDRLLRISQESGGKRLIRDLMKLPDGQKYAEWRPVRGNPQLPDLLPKRRTAHTRKVENYDEPTGRIFTKEDLLARLTESHAEATRSAKSR